MERSVNSIHAILIFRVLYSSEVIPMAAQIHMDVEAAYAAQSTMNDAWGKMDAAFTEIKNATDGIRNQGEWISPSHLEFMDLWTDWAGHIENGLAQLADFKDQLGREIADWEEKASKLG
jgi:uncharacterized protein YukE